MKPERIPCFCPNIYLGRIFSGLINGSPTMRAERAKPKSRRDDMIVAQGKRSAALGGGPKIFSSFFPSGLARQRRARPEGKKELGWGGGLPRAAASAALPWAIIRPPLRGSGKANQTLEPAAAGASVIASRSGRFVPWSSIGGCGSAHRSASA